MTPTTSNGPGFHVRGDLSTFSALAILAVIVALAVAFVAQIWGSPAPARPGGVLVVPSAVSPES